MTRPSVSAVQQPEAARKGLTYVAEAREVMDSCRKAYQWWRNRNDFTLHLPADDPLYADALAWIMALDPARDTRALSVKTSNGPGDGMEIAHDDDDPGPKVPTRLMVAPRTTAGQVVVLEGHRVEAVVVEPDMKEERNYRAPDRLVFTCRSREAQQCVSRHLARLLDSRDSRSRKPVIRLLNPAWGSWGRRGDLPPRPVESVVLADGQMERLIADLGCFLDEEAIYNARAVPWHRGYLFHGEPGTGKTSIAKALAGHFGLDLWYAPLGDVKDDSGLLNLLSQVHPRSMLLLEDVDVFAATQEREADVSAHLSLSGLLNALDGVATPHGLVTVMTTNVPDVLDKALIRPGRMDMVEEIGRPTPEQTARMFNAFYGAPLPGAVKRMMPLEPHGRTSAEVTEVFKRNMHDPEAALRAMRMPKHAGLTVG